MQADWVGRLSFMILLYGSIAVGGAQSPNLNFLLLSIDIVSLQMPLCFHTLHLGWLAVSTKAGKIIIQRRLPEIHTLSKKGRVRMCINSLVLSSWNTQRCEEIAVPRPGQWIAFPRPHCPLQCQSGVPIMGLKEWRGFHTHWLTLITRHSRPCILQTEKFQAISSQ